MARTSIQPRVRFAPLTELNVYVVHEHQIDALAQGTMTSLLLNFSLSLFFLGIAAMSLGTLWSVPATDRVYYTFLILFLVTSIAGAVTLAVWARLHRSTGTLLTAIKLQMPPSPAVRERPEDATQGE